MRGIARHIIKEESRLREPIRYTFYSVQSEFNSVQSAYIAQRVRHLLASSLNLPHGILHSMTR